MSDDDLDFGKMGGIIDPPTIQWHKETKLYIGGKANTLFTGFGIPVGQDAHLDAAMEEVAAAAVAAGKGGWRKVVVQFEAGNREEHWIRAGIEVFVIARGVQRIYDKAIMGEPDMLIGDINAPMVDRVGIALGWEPKRDRAKNLVWKNDLTPDNRSYHRMPVMLRGVTNYPSVLQLITLSTMTDNIVEALERHRDLVLNAIKAKTAMGAAVRQQIKAIHAEMIVDAKIDPEGDEAKNMRKRFPFWGASLILAEGGLQDKGKVTKKSVNVFKALIPETVTPEWLGRRLAASHERAYADPAITETVHWSNVISRQAQTLRPDERMDVLRKRAAALRQPVLVAEEDVEDAPI